MDPITIKKPEAQQPPQQPGDKKICPILSVAPLVGGQSKLVGAPPANPIACFQDRCEFWDYMAIATPDGVQQVGGCSIKQLGRAFGLGLGMVAEAVQSLQELKARELDVLKVKP